MKTRKIGFSAAAVPALRTDSDAHSLEWERESFALDGLARSTRFSLPGGPLETFCFAF